MNPKSVDRRSQTTVAGSKHIVVIDDNKERRELLMFALADGGWQARAVSGLLEARKLISIWPCSIVLGTQFMGSLAGEACLQVLKEQFPHLRCLIVIEDIARWRSSRGINAAIDGCLYKPFTLANLHRVLAEPMGVWHKIAIFTQYGSRLKQLCATHWMKLKRRWNQYRLLDSAKWRERCFREFLHGVRSGGLAWGGALTVWDRLEELEEAWALARDGALDRTVLEESYRYLSDFMVGCCRSEHRFWPHKRSDKAVDGRLFVGLFSQIRADKITLEQLLSASQLRRQAVQSTSASYRRIFRAVWGEKPYLSAPALGNIGLKPRTATEKGRNIWRLKPKEPVQMN